jgi:hypothetical protein
MKVAAARAGLTPAEVGSSIEKLPAYDEKNFIPVDL